VEIELIENPDEIHSYGIFVNGEARYYTNSPVDARCVLSSFGRSLKRYGRIYAPKLKSVKTIKSEDIE
jgi:hypothetical protein